MFDYVCNCETEIRNESLERDGRSLSSNDENLASPCQWLFGLVNFWAAGSQSFERSNFCTAWEMKKIYVCPSCGSAV